MTIVTNHELRKKFEEVQQQSQIGIRGIATPTHINTETEETNSGFIITEKEINGVQNDMMLCTDGTKAKLYSPLPGIKWRCTNAVGSQGLIALEKTLKGLILNDGTTNYCLGVSGDTSEFELLLKVGKNEIRINDLFINLNTKLLVKNGLEQEEN